MAVKLQLLVHAALEVALGHQPCVGPEAPEGENGRRSGATS